MAAIVYDGGFETVSVSWGFGHYVFERGTPVDVPDDLAKRLLEQDTYSAADEDTKPADDVAKRTAALFGKTEADTYRKPCCDEDTEEPCEDCEEDVNG